MNRILFVHFVFFAFIFSLINGCTSPKAYTDKEMKEYDEHSQYAIEERPGGFYLIVSYTRFQFFPESSALLVACKQTLTNIAWDISEKNGKKIKQVDEQRIKISTGRNEITGLTSCSAKAPIDYESNTTK